MPFWLSGADFRHRADAWKPQPQCQPDVQPGAPHRRRDFGKSFRLELCDRRFDVRTVGGALRPFIQSQTNPMIYSATFRDRRVGGPRVAVRSMIWPNDENGGLIHD
jgi:hypothetical protein